VKTRDLIAALQEADPSGDKEVSVGNTDIHFVDVEPAYWDGCLQVLKRDPTNEYYNMIGAEYRATGKKVVIHTLSVKQALLNDPEMPVTFDGEYAKSHYWAAVEEQRREMRKIKEEALKKVAAMRASRDSE